MTVLDIAKELISFDTSGPPAKEKPCAEWILDFLAEIGVQGELQEVSENRANVIAKIGQGKPPGLLLSGHIDVVLPGELDLWTITQPFQPKVTGNKLYGRGACDMKGPDACILQAVKDLAKEKFKRQLTVVFTSGEDTEGWFVQKVVEEKKVSPKDALYGIIPEPSSLKIIRTHKGAGSARIVIYGKAAHSSTPNLGINAIMKSADFLLDLKKLKRSLAKEKHELLGSTTVECTIIKGGFKANIIPDTCEILLNFRLLPKHQSVETINKWVQGILDARSKKDRKFTGKILETSARLPLDVDENLEIIRILQKILGTEVIGAPYYTEAVDYTLHGIPTVICGPGSINQAHTPNEYITVEQLRQGVKMFKEVIKQTCL